MCGRTYNQIWRDADAEIKDLIELENTKNPALIPPAV